MQRIGDRRHKGLFIGAAICFRVRRFTKAGRKPMPVNYQDALKRIAKPWSFQQDRLTH